MEHTADFGIQVFGADPKELFANAAQALFDQITDRDTLKGVYSQRIQVSGDDWPDLMVNWLRELLFFWTGRELLVETARIVSISENRLIAKVTFEPYDPYRHVIKDEIKAVTYHQIQVNQGSEGWEAKVIFDV